MKIDVKNLWKTRKKLILGIAAGVAAAAVGCGFWYKAGHSSSEPVYVFPFQYIGMTEYWGDSQESYGPVSTDKIQTVFLSGTQSVTEVLVQAGDTVKKGDLLMTFDTTLSDLQLERKRLDVEKLKLQLQDARDELREINSMKPMEVPEETKPPKEEEKDLGKKLTEDKLYPKLNDSSNRKIYDGSSAKKAVIYWILNDTRINDDVLEKVDRHVAAIREMNNPTPEETEPKETESTATEPTETEPTATEPTETEPTETEPTETEPTATEPTETEPTATEPTETEPTETEPTETEPTATEPTETEPTETEPAATEPTETEPTATEPTETETTETEPTETEGNGDPEQSNASAAEDPVLPDDSTFYVVFKTTADDMTKGELKTWQCLKVKKKKGSYSFQFANGMIADYSAPKEKETTTQTPEVDIGSGYTAAQIAQMRSDKQKTIKDLDFKVKMAEAEYKIMQAELGDGKVFAQIDGHVVSVLTEEEAKQNVQPLLKVSGGGGFFVEGSVSELEKGNMQIGQEVTINDWNTGMMYTGTVQSIGDFPKQDGNYNGNGNPNASYYPFKVFVDESADLQAGSYVSVMYSTAQSENGIYLENPFLRTEKGKSYVLVLGENGKLEQRWVTTGKSLWGSYTEILSGMTAEDLVAFPYGKNVKPGVAAQEGDLSQLYG